MDLPIYCRSVDDFQWWEDAFGNKQPISEIGSQYLSDMIDFLKRVVKDDTECNIDTCNGFINSMTEELNCRGSK